MGKKILLPICLAFLVSSTAYAHVSGSFKDFLTGIKDESTTEKLKKEIQETKEEIKELTPKVNQLKHEYDKKSEEAVSELQFYRTIGLDTYMKLMTSSDDIVDILANRRLIEKKIAEDLQDLNTLYLSYMPLKLAKASLEGHSDLLEMIEANLHARKKLIQSNENLSPQEIASMAVINWGANAAYLDEYLKKDSDLLNEHIKEFVTRKSFDSPYRLEDYLLNQKTKLTYYFRSDHVYVNYKKEDADVILIGQIFKTDIKSASLQFEAGFLNGIQLSNDLLSKLPGFTINYSQLSPQSETFYVEQANGEIVIQPVESARE